MTYHVLRCPAGDSLRYLSTSTNGGGGRRGGRCQGSLSDVALDLADIEHSLRSGSTDVLSWRLDTRFFRFIMPRESTAPSTPQPCNPIIDVGGYWTIRFRG